jgi:multidrug transporter EmrE-like cation transporter
MRWIIPLVFLIVFESIADIFATKRSQNQIIWFAIFAIAFYIICNIFWLLALKNWSWLWRGAIIFSVASAILAVIIGILLFKESFSTINIAGILLGITAIILLNI